MGKTSIEWTRGDDGAGETWNPTTGCDRVSPGCDNCYALTLAKRLKGMGSAKYQRDGDPRTSGPGFGITEHPDTLATPLSWRKPRKVFVNSMSDLFHDGVSDEFIARVWAVMAATPKHTYQVLTKRHGRMRSLLSSEAFQDQAIDLVGAQFDMEDGVTWPLRNVWLGVSVEDQKRADLRIPALLQTTAAVRFLSCEPLLGPVDILQAVNKLDWLDEANWKPGGIDWVIVGGESGPGARPMHPAWARQLRDECTASGVPFFFKQHGAWGETGEKIVARDRRTLAMHPAGMIALTPDNPFDPFEVGHPHWVGMRQVGKHDAGRDLDGRTWDEYPAVAS